MSNKNVITKPFTLKQIREMLVVATVEDVGPSVTVILFDGTAHWRVTSFPDNIIWSKNESRPKTLGRYEEAEGTLSSDSFNSLVNRPPYNAEGTISLTRVFPKQKVCWEKATLDNVHNGMDSKEKIKIVCDHYGLRNQTTVLMEECAEVVQACSKILRFIDTEPVEKIDKRVDALIEEMADVQCCFSSITQCLSDSDKCSYDYEKISDKVLGMKLDKLDRQVKRVLLNDDHYGEK